MTMKLLWNERWAEPVAAYGDQPNEFLAASVAALPEGGTVVCLADGDGRNGLWLAARGFDVIAVDASEVAVARANARDVSGYRAFVADLADWAVPPCDAIVSIYAHLPVAFRRTVHERAFAALRPGGVFLLEGFSPDQVRRERTSGGPKDVSMLFTCELLRGDLPGAEFSLLEEVTTTLAEGPYHAGDAEVVRCIARKSDSPAPRSG